MQQRPAVDGQPFGLVMRTWAAPAGLHTGRAAFMDFPEQGTDCWMFMLHAPKLKAADYLGRPRLQRLGKAGKNGVLNP